jgi:DNA-binding transcriptional LysR family regulator
MAKWDDYEAFCRVAEQGGFTAAARFMDVPKSSLSAAIRRLEDSLNIRLVERSTRAVRLTEAGSFLYATVRPLFAQLRDAREETLSFSAQVSGTLRIAAPYEFSAHHLSAVACDLMRKHAALNIEIDMRYGQISLFEENYDIVFSMVEDDLPPSNVIARRIVALERGIFAAPQLLAAFGTPARPDELARLPIIATMHDTQWLFHDRRRAAVSVTLPAPRLRSSNADVRRQAAIAGLGVARITASFCQDAVEASQLVRLLPGNACEPLNIYAIFPSRDLVSYKVRTFLDALDTRYRGGDSAARVEAGAVEPPRTARRARGRT